MPDIQATSPDGRTGIMHEDGSFTPAATAATVAPIAAASPATGQAGFGDVRATSPDGRTGIMHADGSFVPDTATPPKPGNPGADDNSFMTALKHVGSGVYGFAKDSVAAAHEQALALGNGLLMGSAPAIEAKLHSMFTGNSYEEDRKRFQAEDISRKKNQSGVSSLINSAAPAVTAALVPGGVLAQGFAMGAGEATGEGISAGKSASQIVPEAALQGGVSAVAGKVGEKVVNSMLHGAGEKAVDWVSRELLGTDAATAAKGKTVTGLLDSAKAVEKVAAAEPELTAAVAKARSGDKAALQDLSNKAEELLKPERDARPENYAKLEQAEPIKVNNVAKSLRDAADKMPAGDEVAERGLRKWADRLEQKHGFLDRGKEIDKGLTLGTALDNYHQVLADNPGNKEALSGIRELHDAFGNPDATIPAKDLRDFVTDLQRDKAGAVSNDFAPSLREEIKSKIAAPAQKYLNDYLDRVATKSPDLESVVNDVRKSNERMRGLITIKDIADQRLGMAQTNALAGRTPITSPAEKLVHGATALGAVVAGASGHLAPAAVIGGAVAGTLAAKKVAERALIGLIRAKAAGSITAAMVEQAIKAGVPRAAAAGASGLMSYARGN